MSAKTTISLATLVKAPIQKVFDASRNVDLHLLSTAQTDERAIGGKTSGLLELKEFVIWQGRHFGVDLTHKSEITKMEAPFSFTDEMTHGRFKSFVHEHHFSYQDGVTTMIDDLNYEVPFGIIGSVFDGLVLKKYMTRFLKKRNALLKKVCEDDIKRSFEFESIVESLDEITVHHR